MSAGASSDESSILSLKNELKEWEKVFARENGGRKPGREDIKRDAVIAVKYKEYDRLRKKPADAKATPTKSATKDRHQGDGAALKERAANTITATPKRDPKDKQSMKLVQLRPTIEEEPTPACVRFALGPTPQKDGEVLGIFDDLPAATPSKGNNAPVAIPDFAVAATPSKHTSSSSDPKLSRTPQSSGKRFFLGAFAGTPLKRKREDDEYCTPSTAKRQFATPAFLRRNVPLARIDEERSDGKTTALPFKKRSLVRSLSSMIAGLRKQVDDEMDDEWEIMREIEEESGNPSRNDEQKVLVEDSQAVEMPLGPDRGPEVSDEAADVDPGSLDANGNPRKVWKKKGQKRQTKRVKMRPVTHKAKKAVNAQTVEDHTIDSELLEETQDLGSKPAASEEQALDSGSEILNAEAGESDFQEDDDESSTEAKASKKSNKKHSAKSKTQDDSNDKKDRKPKKVSAQAHANFRKLKIKNKNSKANGKGRRFGRR